MSLALPEDAVGIMTQAGHDYALPARHEMDTTDRFHWYRIVHEGGADGTVALFVDGQEVCRVPMTDLRPNTVRGLNVICVMWPTRSVRTIRWDGFRLILLWWRLTLAHRSITNSSTNTDNPTLTAFG